MKRIAFFLFWSILAFSFSVGAETESISPELADVLKGIRQQVESENVPPHSVAHPVVGAEQASGKVLIFRPNSDWNDPASIQWEWHPSDSPQIRPEHHRWFSHPDECKPVLGTSHLLLTASGNGVALVRLEDKATLFYTHVSGNPHSAELLPDGNIVSISSAGYFTVHAVPETFTGPDVFTRQYPIVGGHGIVWDRRSQRLWALGYTELAAYRYNFDKEKPAFTKEYSLPLKGTLAEHGHDLYPIPGTHAFFVTGVGIAIFDIPSRTLIPLSDKKRIKSISLSPEGQLIVLSPTVDWWSPTVSYLNLPLSPFAHREGAKFYKARWWIPSSF